MMVLVFWVSAFLVVYPVLVYPAVLLALGWLWPRPVRREPQWPTVTVLIPAHDEAESIRATLENKLALDYPREKLQILVVSDGSTDGTDEIVRGFTYRGVELLRQEPRRGKAAALNSAVAHARGEILVFSDANSLFHPSAVRFLVESLADPAVGYVTGRLSFGEGREATVAGGIGGYMAYENALRVLETRFDSVIGVNGGVDATRRRLYSPVPETQLTDFVLPLRCIESGFRVVYDERATSVERPNTAVDTEFRMRVRVALRALQALAYMRSLLLPWRHPRAAFCLWSHKVLRYTTPTLLPATLLSALWLARDSRFYLWMAALQLAGYGAAALSPVGVLPRRLLPPARVLSYFVLSSAAFTVALFRWLRGETMATWKPRGG
jgi:cellulose synthase/poly-beta-1,6-N-acetylglucosamine synthase-like glycosyltransferase